MNLWLIFLTGLTTGGLTCMALQGGLLATAIAAQRDVPNDTSQKDVPFGSSRRNARSGAFRKVVPGESVEAETNNNLRRAILPTTLFLLAKISAYTVVGFLLGLFGSLFQLSITTQIIMQLVVGLFMIATALRMLDVHPVFRRFALTPPKAIFKFMRGNAKSGSYFSPIVLGLATIFLPCATTQAMEIQAIGSGSAVSGALILLAFTLGTAPIFFILGTLATRFSQTMERFVYPVAATLILFLGILALDNGLTLAGSPLTLKGFWQTATSFDAPQKTLGTATPTGEKQTLNITVYATGYEPRQMSAKAGIPLTLKLTTNKTQGCSRSITFPTLNIQKLLPETGVTELELPALARGKVPFSCSMGMFSGTIEVI